MAASLGYAAGASRPATVRVGAGTKAPPKGGGVGMTRPGAKAAHVGVTRAAGIRSGQAKAKSLTPGEVLANRPGNWTQPLTPRQVVQQATAAVEASYNPVLNSINQEANIENGILSKQESDNQFYTNWLSTKGAALMANQNTVDQQTQALASQLSGDQASLFGRQPGELTAQANAQPGNVNNNAPAFTAGESALGNALASNHDAMRAELGAATNQTGQLEQSATGETSSAILNSGSAIAAGQAKEVGNYQNAMLKIAGEKSTLSTREGAALLSEITRLQGAQTALSENDRNYNTAVQKLGISAANTSSEIAARSATTTLNRQKFNATLAQNKFNDWVKQEQLGQGQERINQAGQKIAISLANSNSTTALHNAEIAKDRKTGALSLVSQNTLYDQIQKASGAINGLMQKYGLTGAQAYQAVLTGSFPGQKQTSTGKNYTGTISSPFKLTNQSLLNAAYNTSVAGSGLTSGDVRYLTQLGLTNISSRLTVASNGVANISQGGANSPH